MSEIAFKKWELILSTETAIDKETYLLTSLIPYGFMHVHPQDRRRYFCVDLQQIKKLTNYALKGFQLLADKGYAKWFELSEDNSFDGIIGDNDEGILMLGIYSGLRNIIFMWEDLASTSVGVINAGVAPKVEDVEVLKTIYSEYKFHCDNTGETRQAILLKKRLDEYLLKMHTKKANRTDFLGYFLCVKAMHERTNYFPTKSKLEKIKDSYALDIIMKGLIPKEAIEIVPYFIYNFYDCIGNSKFQDPNVYSFKFTFATTLGKLRGTGKPANAKHTTNKGRFTDDDRL